MPLIDPILYVLPLTGIGFIIIALICNKNLSDRKVINLKLKKIGLFLIADAFGLIVLIGIMMIGTGIYFVSQKYDSKIESYEKKVNDQESTIAALSEIRVHLSLDFPPENPAKPGSAKAKILLKKALSAENAFDFHDEYVDKSDTMSMSMSLVVYEVGIGDMLRVVVEDNGKQWISNTLRIPDNRLKMILQ